MQGSRQLGVTQQQAWDALNDPEVLKICIPGCDKVEATGENQYAIGMALKIGPVSAKFGGKIVLVSAAYNAGPRRPIRWMSEQGDPRGMSAEQVVDWIEHIPFRHAELCDARGGIHADLPRPHGPRSASRALQPRIVRRHGSAARAIG